MEAKVLLIVQTSNLVIYNVPPRKGFKQIHTPWYCTDIKIVEV